MSEAILLAAILALVASLVLVVHLETRILRDELTANRMERAEMLQRIQAPDVAVAEHSYKTVRPEVAETLDSEQRIDSDWEKSDESLVQWDEDLMFDSVE